MFSFDFSVLKEINSLIENKGILLSPERQFLLLRNWSFFDEFEVNGEIKKKQLEGIPEIAFNFASGSLKENLSEMLVFSKQNTKEFLSKLILSNVLCTKLIDLPKSKSHILDSFIESVLFKNNFVLPKKQAKFDSGFVEKNRFKDLKKVDFSFVWPVLFSFPFYNLGFNSVNCSCCKPDSLNEKNILPSSLIEIKFLEEGIYFESTNSEFSSFFHSNSSGKEKRLKRKNEWNLHGIPLGPFFRNDVLRVPLNDAVRLVQEEKAVFLSDHNLSWFCRKKENFLSIELNELNKKIVFFDKKLTEIEKNSIKENGIGFSLFLDSSPEFNFFSEFVVLLKSIFSSTPFHLISLSFVFFDADLACAVRNVFSSVLLKFNEFSNLNSSKSFISSNNVLLDSDNPLKVISDFSKNQNLPVPELVV
ncbi:MAG: hypothetical protein COT90_01315 [Candidatus Diapherotrites archaeon CG10_big_fil_rev_8_21_14_0_10_31_34]|nr:MAG: hypothetical protein COT90_01315 [Candidatus Diapherotrites archaeon CG10_big_fil_rev_8_21_14_0_10_31_34]